MKAKSTKESTRLAETAMNRAARKILSRAVHDQEAIPLWDGTKVVWKIPAEEAEQLDALETPSSSQ